jgi:hypothetical protein
MGQIFKARANILKAKWLKIALYGSRDRVNHNRESDYHGRETEVISLTSAHRKTINTEGWHSVFQSLLPGL